MANIELNKVAEQLNHRVLYSVEGTRTRTTWNFRSPSRTRDRRLQTKPLSSPPPSSSPKNLRRRRDSRSEQQRVADREKSATFAGMAPCPGLLFSKPRSA